MLHEAGYDVIPLYSATKGMNQKIGANLLPLDYSYYIENIMPTSLGEGQVRYGTAEYFTATDTIIEAFPFQTAGGNYQKVLYFNGYDDFLTYDNLSITSDNKIVLTSVNYALFKKDTYLSLRYTDLFGLSGLKYYQILAIEDISGNTDILGGTYPQNTILIVLGSNSFPDDLIDFYIEETHATGFTYNAANSFTMLVPNTFNASLYYAVTQRLILTINAVQYEGRIASIDISTPGQVTFVFTDNILPAFTGVDAVSLEFQSLSPILSNLYNSYGYIKVLDCSTGALLTGGNQTLSGLSVACVPRCEFFGGNLIICNGVDPNMVWTGSVLSFYSEYVKEGSRGTIPAFNRIDARRFSFTASGTFNILNYPAGSLVNLSVNGAISNLTVTASTLVGTLATITVSTDLPAFDGTNIVDLFYTAQPPPFSYMKAWNDRLWCLGTGAVSLNYRDPSQALVVYYSYDAYQKSTGFRFFNETTKTVPSIDISAKHGGADNLEAILSINNNLAFVGRNKTQVWGGIDPVEGTFDWVSTLPVGIFHGNLAIELPNDTYFLSQNGILSFSTLNIAKQFAASNVDAMDKTFIKYIESIDNNFQYRACRSFKYNRGGFAGFKVGFNDIVVSKYHTTLFWWCIFSGDFSKSNTFLSALDESLYLYVDNVIFTYADGVVGKPVYGDNNGDNFITFIETKYVNSIKNRYSNKRFDYMCDYSSDLVTNPNNIVYIMVSGDLRDTFIHQQIYELPLQGDVLGTIPLVNGDGLDPTNPSNKALGMRLSKPSHPQMGRLQFLASSFSVSIVGAVQNGPFSLKRIRLLGIKER